MKRKTSRFIFLELFALYCVIELIFIEGLNESIMLARQYEIFLEVCRTGQFTKAAKSLGISQSAVSQCIKTLEGTLKIELVNRIARSVRITEEGRVLKEVLENQKKYLIRH